MFFKKEIYAFGVILIALSGCGGGSNATTSDLTNNTNTKVGYVIDAPVANLNYKCGNKTAKTNTDGKFECTTLPVTFFIGNIEIGSISSINSDTKVFIQDIVKVDRSDFNNTKVLKLAILLQSLDKDKNSSNSISIPDDLNLSSTKSFDDLSLTELNSLLTTAGFTPVSSSDAEQHLREFSDIDTLAPTLKLNGESSISISKNEAYKELGATAKDDRDNNLTIVITGSVKTDTVGSYVLKYNVSDKAGNKARELTRTVTVKEIVPVVVNASNLDISKEGDITPVIFNSTAGAITSCSISPALPTGLTLSDDCQITGATSSYLPSTAYTITATNEAGSTTANINISVAIPYTATDTLLEDQWYIKNTGTAPDTWGDFTTLTAGADMGVVGAWNQGISGEQVIVTVVDDGVDFTHSDLEEAEVDDLSIQTLSPITVLDEKTKLPKNAHGTGCAGIIAGNKNQNGIVGISPNTGIISYHYINNGPVSEPYLRILETNLSRVSNHSYGPKDNGQLHIQASTEYDAIESLVTQSSSGKGHVLLFAAGNGRAYVPKEYKPSDLSPDYASYDAEEVIKQTFGDYAGLDMSQQHPYVISVSGFNANDKDVSYAEAGPATLVAGATGATLPGPKGTNISTGKIVPGSYTVDGATNPAAAAMATAGRTGFSYVDTSSFRDGGTDEPNGFNMAFNGTSAATPTVSAIVALMISANPNLTWRDVRWVLAKTARKIQAGQNITNQATGKPSTGEFAKPIWSTSGNDTFGKFSHYFGYGAANANAAVELVKNANYTLLPTFEECIVSVINNVATIPEQGCPNTIEFVQVKFTAGSGMNINNESYTIQHKNNIGKIILLLRPSTCGEDVDCSIATNVVAKTGTVGFLGDTLSKDDTFTFTTSSGNITTSEIMVFGHSN